MATGRERHETAEEGAAADELDYESRVAARMPTADLDAWLLFTFSLAAGRRAEVVLGDHVRRHGLDRAQFSVLLMLWLSGPPHRLSPTTLGSNITQSLPGVSHTVRRLTNAGLVARSGDTADGRTKYVELTEHGEDVVRRCASELADIVREMFAGMSRPLADLASAQYETFEALSQWTAKRPPEGA